MLFRNRAEFEVLEGFVMASVATAPYLLCYFHSALMERACLGDKYRVLRAVIFFQSFGTHNIPFAPLVTYHLPICDTTNSILRHILSHLKSLTRSIQPAWATTLQTQIPTSSSLVVESRTSRLLRKHGSGHGRDMASSPSVHLTTRSPCKQ